MTDKVVFDFYNTLVRQPDIFKHRVEWRPGAEELLRDIGFMLLYGLLIVNLLKRWNHP